VQVVLAPNVRGDHLVDLVTADAQRARDDDIVQRDHGGFGCPAADIDDHVAGGAGDRHVGADGRGQRLGDQMGFVGACLNGGGEHGATFDVGDPGGYAHHDHG